MPRVVDDRGRYASYQGASTDEATSDLCGGAMRTVGVRSLGLPLRVSGWDGGRIAEPYDVERLLVGPGGRYDVAIAFDRPRR